MGQGCFDPASYRAPAIGPVRLERSGIIFTLGGKLLERWLVAFCAIRRFGHVGRGRSASDINHRYMIPGGFGSVLAFKSLPSHYPPPGLRKPSAERPDGSEIPNDFEVRARHQLHVGVGESHGAANRAAPHGRLVCHHQLLEQHIAGNVAIGCALAATCQLLAVVAL